jgi:protein-S-isoprenylcysteine O-methyltransferase Ste14
MMVVEYLGFILSSVFYFKKSDTLNPDILIMKITGIVLIFINLFLSFKINFTFKLDCFMSLFFVFFSAALFFWTLYFNRSEKFYFAFTSMRQDSFISSGPYRYIRHPFYSSYIFAWIGGVLFTHSLISLCLSGIMTVLYFKAAIAEERQFLSGPHKIEYMTYVQNTGRFFPRLW